MDAGSQLFSVNQGGVQTDVSFGQVLELRKTDKDVEVSTPCDPGDDTLLEDDDGPLDGDIYFYVHNHLGNTRVLYHTEFDCENPGISYIFDYVVDYDPQIE